MELLRRHTQVGELVARVSRSASSSRILRSRKPSTRKRKAVTEVWITWGVVLLIGIIIQALVNHIGEGGANGDLANNFPIYVIWFVCTLVYHLRWFRNGFVPSTFLSTEELASHSRDVAGQQHADIHNEDGETKDNVNEDGRSRPYHCSISSPPVCLGHQLQVPLLEEDEENQVPLPRPSTHNPKKSNIRLNYLDNLKVFLIFIVVCGHTADNLSFFFKDTNVSEEQAAGLFSLNVLVDVLFQGCIMPLFFFMSAINIPRSYNHLAGNPDKFMDNKKKRLFIPATVTALIIIPLEGFGIDLLENGWNANPFHHCPKPKHTWYILWLLVLCWGYSMLRQAMTMDQQASNAQARPSPGEDPTQVHKVKMTAATAATGTGTTSSSALLPFPSFFQRYVLVGFLGCGWAMLVIVLAIDAPYFSGTFWGVPINIGSYTCDLILFVAGILAAHNSWLPGTGPTNTPQKPLEQLIGMPMWRLRVQAFAESLMVVYLRMMKPNPENRIWYGMVMYGIAGIYCVDMSVAVLQFFQQYLNFHNRFTKFLGGGAYLVYLIHPAILAHLTALFLFMYTKILGPVLNDDGEVATDRLLHEQWHIGICYVFVLVFGHLTCWPLGFFLQQWLVRRGLL